MEKTRLTTDSFKDTGVSTADISTNAVTTNKLKSNSVTTGKINDGQVTASDLASTLDLSSKTLSLAESSFNTPHYNVALLGFKMAVTESLTVFNLVDGVVDEFHDESGTDEAEGTNDNYVAASDLYLNSTTPDGSDIPYSAGFDMHGVTESDTSQAGANPTHGQDPSTEFATYTVPTGVSSVNIQVWGAGGNGQGQGPLGRDFRSGGGGGYAEGTLAVTASQTLQVMAGEGGGVYPCSGGVKGGNGGGGGGGNCGGGGGGIAGVFASPAEVAPDLSTAPQAYIVAGSGGGASDLPQSGGFHGSGGTMPQGNIGKLGSTGGGGGGGLIGLTYDPESASPAFQVRSVAQTNQGGILGEAGGGGSQTAGGQGSQGPTGGDGGTGALFTGAEASCSSNGYPGKAGGGGAGYYGGGAGSAGPNPGNGNAAGGGGGGSSYYAHPQITSGATEAAGNSECGAESGGSAISGYAETGIPASGNVGEGGGVNPEFSAPPGSGDGGAPSPNSGRGEDGFVLITGTASASATTTNIVSNSFTAQSAPSTSRIVVFKEDVDSATLNTDIIASVSRNGGSNFTNVTLVDEGYVVGSSGQRILAGLVDISGQPSGTSMRWKLALLNNQSKIHGVSLSWG